MYLSSAERRRVLLSRVREQGYLRTRGLAEEFSVDGSTIRRDLAHLERSGLVLRTRGGLKPATPDLVVDVPYDVRRSMQLGAKVALAAAAADLVEDGQTVILDSGSTMYHLGAALRRRRDLTVVTNDLLVAGRVAQTRNRVQVTGGLVLDTVYTLVGPDAEAGFRARPAAWAFIGAEAVSPDGLTNINKAEVPVKRAMMEAADNVVLVADSSKFGRVAREFVASLSAVSYLITDDGLPEGADTEYGTTIVRVSAAK